MTTRRGASFPAGGNYTNLIFNLPTGLNPGDLLVAVWVGGADVGATLPAGWAKVAEPYVVSPSLNLGVVLAWKKVDSSSESGASVTFSSTAATRQGLAFLAYTPSAGKELLLDGFQIASGFTAPSLTRGNPNQSGVVLRGSATRHGANLLTWASPNTEVGEGNANGTGGKAWAVSELLNVSGAVPSGAFVATDTTTSTVVTQANTASWTLALREAPVAVSHTYPLATNVSGTNLRRRLLQVDSAGTPSSVRVVRELKSPTVSQLTAPVVLAHRMGGNHFPENTMYAANKSLVLRPDMGLEMDLYRSSEAGVAGLVCSHDATVDRTSADGLTGPVSGFTVAQFRAIKQLWPASSTASQKPAVYGASWKELADLWGGRRILCVEAKDQASTDLLLPDVLARGIQSRTIYTSFTLARCQQAEAAGIRSILTFSGAPDLAAVVSAGIWGIALYTTYATPQVVADANAAGVKVFVNQVTSSSQAANYAGAFGFPTDEPWTLTQTPVP